MTGPGCVDVIRSIARLTAATSSASDVNGSCAAATLKPLACSNGITRDQLEPSAHAPCTRTTFRVEAFRPGPASGWLANDTVSPTAMTATEFARRLLFLNIEST